MYFCNLHSYPQAIVSKQFLFVYWIKFYVWIVVQSRAKEGAWPVTFFSNWSYIRQVRDLSPTWSHVGVGMIFYEGGGQILCEGDNYVITITYVRWHNYTVHTFPFVLNRKAQLWPIDLFNEVTRRQFIQIHSNDNNLSSAIRSTFSLTGWLNGQKNCHAQEQREINQ